MLPKEIIKKSLRVCLGILLFSMAACTATKETPEFVVVNVLDAEYHDDCHIKGSINVPFMELEKYALEHWNKEKTQIVLYCGNYKCTASGFGARMLRDLGFKHAWAYEGGSAEWIKKGFPIVGVCKEQYLQDHELTEEMLRNMSKHHEIIITAEELYKKMLEFQ